jgi:predicted ATP-grasp superfamily ATP-dependent carboligase
VIRSILVTDGEERSALAVVRSLGRRGHRVYVCSRTGRSIAGASRHAAEERSVASPLSGPEAFALDLRALVSEWGIDVLIPMTEQSFNAVFANEALFQDVCIPAPSSEQFRAISDKQRVLEVAETCGIRVPAQVALSTPGDSALLSASVLTFPLVIKPARSVGQDSNRQLKFGVAHCADWNQLQQSLSRFPAAAYPLLLQQRVIGPGIGIFLLVWDGELVAAFAHRRIREKPPAGGVSVYRESIAADPALVERSRRLLDRFGWRGVAMIEYKVEQRTGTPFIMEINGRFWGSLQLAIDAGVDFPSLLVARALGEKVRGPGHYKVGIRSKWEWGEVDHALARLRRTDAQLSLPPGSPSRARALLSLLLPWRPGDRLEVLRLSDPAPFLRETVQYFRRG